MINVDTLKKDYKFDTQDEQNGTITIISFADGKKYKLQHPSVMDIHAVLYDSLMEETDLFRLGLKSLFSENEKSPKVDEKYIESNPREMKKWSLIIRGLLSRRWEKIQS